MKSEAGRASEQAPPTSEIQNPTSTAMSTDKQIVANQLNAKKSTGPKTPEGRAAVRLNGLKHGLTARDLRLYIPHQANLRIIKAAVEKMGLEESQVAINIDKYANTTAGTIPICLSEAVDSKTIQPRDLILIASFGAGFTWGSLLLRWEN